MVTGIDRKIEKEMIGGSILSFRSSENTVTFHVKEIESTNKCHVKAFMDISAQRLIDIGADIWWDSESVYLTIGDVADCKFNKIGFSY